MKNKLIAFSIVLFLLSITVSYADVNLNESIWTGGGDFEGNYDINPCDNETCGNVDISIDGVNLNDKLNSRLQGLGSGINLEQLLRLMKNSYRFYIGQYIGASWEEKYIAQWFDAMTDYKLIPYRNKIDQLEKKNIELEMRISALEKAIGSTTNTNFLQKQVNNQFEINRRIEAGDIYCYENIGCIEPNNINTTGKTELELLEEQCEFGVRTDWNDTTPIYSCRESENNTKTINDYCGTITNGTQIEGYNFYVFNSTLDKFEFVGKYEKCPI